MRTILVADGEDFMRLLVRQKLDEHRVVVMVTGRVSESEQRDVLERGVDACITKPLSPSDLRACVEELLSAL